ncbi:hypothetical protein B0T24DRAFT_596627 [Lasiosphaeria ovina]|uniref:Uncharacterized protein n=1 Tax=Lasiosphaeria ovina TaxID=92902 RepID=A0AAE0JZ82_9PEZI|nr:hypothetical protein B0T24DRAFT_596627 [Lasiosphaeria ovina]
MVLPDGEIRISAMQGETKESSAASTAPSRNGNVAEIQEPARAETPATTSAPDPSPPTRITPPAGGTEAVLAGSPAAPAGKNKRKPQRQDDGCNSYNKSDNEDGRSTSVRGSKNTPKAKKPKQHNASPKNGELADFHRRLRNPCDDRLYNAARAFQNILGGAADVEFLWESAGLTPVEIYNNGTLQDATFGTFPSISKNLYQPNGPRRWARPKAWPSHWAWPVDQTKATGCDLCSKASSCGCTDEAFPKVTPLIKRYEGKGIGLQEVAASPGQIAYRKGE